MADYVSKHHTPAVHTKRRPLFLHTKNSPRYLPRGIPPHVLRGCADMYVPTTRTRITPRLGISTIRTHQPTLVYRTLGTTPIRT